MIAILINIILSLRPASPEKNFASMEIISEPPITAVKSKPVCQIIQLKQEFFHEHLWPCLDWQLRGDLIFTNCVEKAIFCLEKENCFALANIESVHLPRIVDAYRQVLAENFKAANKIRYLSMQASFNLFKTAAEQYKDKYQICPRAQALCCNPGLPDQLRQDFLELAKPEINAKSRSLLTSLAVAIKTKYKC
jgi:hypothetical protein